MRQLSILLALLVACKGEDSDPQTDTDIDCVAEDDADEDGWCPPDDCDDTNELVHPDAIEVPYNGRDDDCVGGDLTDVDQDGYDSELVDGEDCDDGNPLVYPGADEPCYADFDWDCDGRWGGDDCDWDSFPYNVDCDDEDDAIYPGAADVWYDGVDSDCGFDSDFDQDVDGDELEWQDDWPDPAWPESIAIWDPDEDELKIRYVAAPTSAEEWNGLDCDDLDTLTGGGLRELWDGLDRDCDDVVDELDSRDTWKGWTASGGVGDYAWGGAVALMGDLDGDGLAEVAVGDVGRNVDGGGEYAGGVYLISSGSEEGRPSEVGLASIDGTAGAFDVIGWSVDAAGDLDDDGLAELVVGAPFVAGSQGGAAIFTGATLAAGGTLDLSDRHALITLGYLAGMEVRGLPDLDGDEVPEVAVGTNCYAEFTSLSLGVFSGADLTSGGAFGSGDALAYLSGSGGGGGIAAGDLSGDGTPELLFGSTDRVSTGEVLLADGAGLLLDGTPTLSTLPSVSGGNGLGATVGFLDDADGDGYGELVVADPTTAGLDSFELGGTVYVIDGDDLLDGTELTSVVAADAAMLQVDAESGYSWLRTERRHADHDGDGHPDLLVGAPGIFDIYGSLSGWWTPLDKGFVYWFPSTTVAAGGVVSGEDAAATFRGINDGSSFGVSWDVGRVDADEVPDLAVGMHGRLNLFLAEL